MTRYGASNDHLYKRRPGRVSKADAIAAAAARSLLFVVAGADIPHTCVVFIGVDGRDECETCGARR